MKQPFNPLICPLCGHADHLKRAFHVGERDFLLCRCGCVWSLGVSDYDLYAVRERLLDLDSLIEG